MVIVCYSCSTKGMVQSGGASEYSDTELEKCNKTGEKYTIVCRM